MPMRLPLGARRPRLGGAGEPVLQALQVGVAPHQVVQGGAARAHEAADHDGSFDLVLQDLGVFAPHLLGTQPLLKRLDHHVARRGAPVLVEAGLPVVGLEQHPHALEIGRIAEVVVAHRPTGFLVEDFFEFDEAHFARVSASGRRRFRCRRGRGSVQGRASRRAPAGGLLRRAAARSARTPGTRPWPWSPLRRRGTRRWD